MPARYRCLTLYDFAEGLESVVSIDHFRRFISYGEFNPTIVSILTHEGKYGKWRKGRFSGLELLESKYGHLSNQKDIVFDRPVEGNFLRSSIHIVYNIEANRYLIAREINEWTFRDIIDHLVEFSNILTPSYGFAADESGPAAFTSSFGIGSSEADPTTLRRIDDLGRSLGQTKEHLVKIHDVYPLNVLNDAHLKCDIRGVALEAWIEAGGHGELTRIKEGMHIWTVADDIRPGIRDILFKAGALIASI